MRDLKDERKMPAPIWAIARKGKAKKRRTLRQNVLHPLLITIFVLSAVMVIFFNLVILLTLYSNMVGDLRSISGTIEQLAEVQPDSQNEAQAVINLYRQEVERRSVSYRINMVVLDENSEISASAADVYAEERETIPKGIQENQQKEEDSSIFRIETGEDILFFSPVHLQLPNGETVYTYASFRSLLETVKSGNQALLIILIISVLGFVLASHIIADNISKPIKELSDHMEVIGDGDFTPVNIKETSEELHTLTVSINEMLARLQAYNDAHAVSLQNLSHDLRTPLMSISGYAEAIKYGVLDNTDEAADVIIKESHRLTEVVEKLLILSDLDTLNQPINMEPLELASFLQDEIKSMDGYAMQSHVKVNSSFPQNDAVVLADKQLLSTVIRNLLSNAIRYANTCVEVRITENDESILVSVADDGAGLSEEDLEHLFLRYYVGKTGHTGLGLSTAKSAAEYMGATILGENRVSLPKTDLLAAETGAVFIVSFPKYE